MDFYPPSHIAVRVRGAELRELYAVRAKLHLVRAESGRERIETLDKAARGNRGGPLRSVTSNPRVTEFQPSDMYGEHAIAHERSQLRWAVDEAERMAKFLTFMAEHVDEAETYKLTDSDVARLVGPLASHGMTGPSTLDLSDAPGPSTLGVVVGRGPHS